MIDRAGGPNPTPPRADCKITDVSMSPNGSKAKISCTGQFTGTGTVETTYNADGSTKTIEHIVATMGSSSRPMDVTIQATSVYKGPDCGTVKPFAMPAAK
jgi:hypothetical protein